MEISFFGLTFHPYGFILGLAILAAFEASLRLAKVRKIGRQTIERLFVWVVSGGIIGARVYHVIDKWKEIYSLDPVSSLYIWNGGLGIWGAVLGGIIGLAAFVKFQFTNSKKQTNLYNLLDIVLFGVPLGQAIGRWGNFFNNEIVGKNGEPLFFYESSLDLLLFALLVLVARKKIRPGVIARGYLIGYGLIRLVLEPLRPEGMIWKIGGIPTASLVSIAAILLGFGLISRRRF
jgi:phosphatidylglycerol:prolipoprotein diacylglycerol transferase